MKVFYAFEILDVIELILNGPVNGLDVTVVAPGPHWNSFVLATETFNGFLKAIPGPVLPEAAYEL